MRNILLFFGLMLSTAKIFAQESSCLKVKYDLIFNEGFDVSNQPVAYDAVLYSWPNHSYFVAIRDKNTPKQGSEEIAALKPDTLWRTSKDLSRGKAMFGAPSITGKEELYQDSLHPMQWTLTEERKMIDSLECFGAWADFRGRRYFAWYAPSIPVTDGPWKLGGLPGLIVEAYEMNKDLYFRARRIGYSEPEKPYRDFGDLSRFSGFDKYVIDLKKTIEQVEGLIAAQGNGQCIDCQTKSKVKFHFWEKVLD